ncbi:MAG: amino acid adenylation domain-containing protein [Nostoc sp.]|uniref:non-ribosomal peptide synthetase n=1 Tax=Nostoc sp. TaxID=1180 RepID=UPI002FF94E55
MNSISALKNITRQELDSAPLSFAQQWLWLIDQLNPGNTYNIPLAIQLKGLLDIRALEQGLGEIVQRHHPLRTTFTAVDGQPLQFIASASNWKLPTVDLTELSESERYQESQRLINESVQQPFDLTTGPLLRAVLQRLSEQEHILLLTIHQIIGDDYSWGVLLQELTTLYEAFSNGLSSPLVKLPIQYADFAIWQREWLLGEVLESQLVYWKQRLGGELPVLKLPIDRPRPAVQTYRGARQSLNLSKDLTAALKSLSQQSGVTLFTTLLAAFKTLLYRYTSQEDIIVGSEIANRNQTEVEGLIGLFANTLVMRTDLGGNPSFRELLGRVQEVVLSAYFHQDLPFEKLVEELQTERDLSRSPLFQVMFVLQSEQVLALEIPGLSLKAIEVESKTAKFDLTLKLQETTENINGCFEYNADLFDADTISRMISHWQVLLESVVAQPNQQISHLPILTPAQQHQLLVEWNDTEVDYPKDKCIHQLFEEQVERTPDRVAVVFEDQQLTYRELNARANQLAHYLQKLGVGSEGNLGICIERSPLMAIALLGILKAGGAYIPIDPSYPLERKAFILNDSQMPVLLTQQHLIADLATDGIKVICIDSDWEVINQQEIENPITTITPLDLAYIIYTSGSTGKPKGTLISHQGLVNYLSWCTKRYAVEEGVGSLVHSPLGFDLTITSLFSPLLVGRTVELLSEEQGIEALSEALKKSSNLSLVKITPAHLDLLKQQLSKAEIANKTRAFIIGGENLLAESITFWQDVAPDTMLINEYGPTETVVGCCVYQIPVGKHSSGSIPIGKAIANTQLYILDQYLQPVPIGVPGELHIGGVGLARGYLNQPELTAQKFIPNPFSKKAGDRLYKTGDLVRFLVDGNIEYLGRIDNQVKIRGFRIEIGEIESVLAQHPAVKQSAIVLREDTPNDKRLVAYVHLESEQTLGIREIRSFLQSKLPNYTIPSTFILLNSLPLTANGKVAYNALPVPNYTRTEFEEIFVAPRTLVEQQLTDIWVNVLKLEKLGIHDNFFALGGHSLLATQIMSRLRQTFRVEIPLRTLFEAPTVAELGNRIDTLRWATQQSQTDTMDSYEEGEI